MRFLRVLTVRTALLLGVLAVALCWAVIFLAHLCLVSLSRITPDRAKDPPERVTTSSTSVERDRARTTA